MLSNRGIKVRSCHTLLTKNEGTTKNIGVLNGERPKQSNYKMASCWCTIMHAISGGERKSFILALIMAVQSCI